MEDAEGGEVGGWEGVGGVVGEAGVALEGGGISFGVEGVRGGGLRGDLRVCCRGSRSSC